MTAGDRIYPDVSQLSDADVFDLWVQSMKELRARKIIRSANNPTGDYAEFLAAKLLDLCLEPNSAEGFDGTDANGIRYQIKSRRLVLEKASRQLSPIRNLDLLLDEAPFDILVVMLFDEAFAVSSCWKIPIDIVRKHAKYRKHVNGWVLIPTVTMLKDPGVEAVDISSLLPG